MSHKNNKISIALAGDVMIGRLVNAQLNNMPPNAVWGNFLPILQQADLRIINLETALTTCSKAVPKVFNFKADPFKVQTLVEAHIDVVNLANNHVLDYSTEGLIETLLTLKNAGISYVGAGKDNEEARKPIVITRQGFQIGIIGCTDNEPSWLATKDSPGTFFLEVGDLDVIRDLILSIRPSVDLLIVTIHWGPNMVVRPNSQFIKFAHQLMDLGVDIIHGHSAHVFQGVQAYKQGLILFDTGDFVDDYYVDRELRNDCSFLFLVEADHKGVQKLRLIPSIISNFQVNRASGKDADLAIKHMRDLSNELGTGLKEVHGELVWARQEAYLEKVG